MIITLKKLEVASLVEAWIEIGFIYVDDRPDTSSPPSWRRGLKYVYNKSTGVMLIVASLVEAWIEIRSFR